MNSGTEKEDYLDQLSGTLPWHRSLTSFERILIVFFVVTFVSIVGCILLCLICSRSPLRRRYSSKKKLDKEQCILVATASRKDALVLPSSPPSYESLVRTDTTIAFNKSNTSRCLELDKKSSYGTASDSDGIQSNGDGDHRPSINGKVFHSQSTRSSASLTSPTPTDIHLLPPFGQVDVELNFDSTRNLLIIHLTNGEHISSHPAFDQQADFFIHVQLLNNKTWKKFHDAGKKHRSTLQLSAWKQQQEKTTKKLSRTSNDKLICDEYLQFELTKDDIGSTSVRFLLFCIDRSSVQDLMFESIIHLNSSIVHKYQQIIQFKDLPQITFAEIYLGLSYLPTAERLTIKINKLRYLCKTDKDEKIDARLLVTFFHHGHRFYQKKFAPILFNQTLAVTHHLYELTETITQNIPQNNIQSIYVHFELVIGISNSTTQSIISCGTILLGEHTRYHSAWQNILVQPRQTHFGWYQFFG